MLTEDEELELLMLQAKAGGVEVNAPKKSASKKSKTDFIKQQGQGFWEGVKQGSSLGLSDEIQAALAAGTVGLANLAGMETGGLTAGDAYNQALEDFRQQYKQAGESAGAARFIGELAGGVATGTAGAGRLAKSAPGITEALATYGKTRPVRSAAGAGLLSGGIYGFGTGQGGAGERLESAILGGALGAGLGAASIPVLRALGAAGRSVVPRNIQEQIDVVPAMREPVSEITGAPLSQTVPTQEIAQQAAQGRVIALPQGVVSKSADVLRAEEAARQGTLGPQAQEQVNRIYEGVREDVAKTVQSLIGKKTGRGKEMLALPIEAFREAGEKMRANASALFERRNEALATAVGDVRKIGPSLGKVIFNTINDPKLKYDFKRNPEVMKFANDFKSIIDEARSQGREIPIGELMALRGQITDFVGANLKTQPGNLAGKLGSNFDDWLENTLDDSMMISGDQNIGKMITEAKDAWATYKKIYEPKIGIAKGITTNLQRTPLEFVDDLAGSGGAFPKQMAQNIRQIAEGLPETNRSAYYDDVFSGLMARAFESSKNKGQFDANSYSKLRNELLKLYESDVYKLSLATAERDAIIPSLIDDLNDFIIQTSRTDVRGPSVGGVTRFLQNLGKVPGLNLPSEVLSRASDMSANAKTRMTLNKAMKQASAAVKERASSAPVIDPVSIRTSLTAGGLSGQTAATSIRSEQ